MKQLSSSTDGINGVVLSALIILFTLMPSGKVLCQNDTAAVPLKIDITAEELIKKYIQALGGEEKLSAIKDETMEAEMTTSFGSMDIEASMTVIRKAPNKSHSLMTMSMMDQQQQIEMWCDGASITMNASFGGMGKDRQITGEDLAEALENNLFNEFIHFRELGFTPTIKEKKLMDGKPIYVLEMKRKHSTGQFGISAETFLMAGMKKNEEIPTGKQLVFIRYSDYKPVNGIMYPFKMTMGAEKMTIETRVKSYKLNTDVSDAVFVKK